MRLCDDTHLRAGTGHHPESSFVRLSRCSGNTCGRICSQGTLEIANPAQPPSRWKVASRTRWFGACLVDFGSPVACPQTASGPTRGGSLGTFRAS